MTMPQLKWRLSIVLTFLLVQSHFCSTDVSSTESEPYKQLETSGGEGSGSGTTNDENYEVIDVAAANRNSDGNTAHVQTGQTTRFFTTGEVDDDFWLKHLGEDFKHAIHLQVGGGSNDHYDDIYNTTLNEDGSTYEIHQRYAPKANNANPVKEDKIRDDGQDMDKATDLKIPTEKNITEDEHNAKTNNSTAQNQKLHHEEQHDNMKFQQQHHQTDKIDVQTPPHLGGKNESVMVTHQNYEPPYERVFAIDNDNNMASKFYNPNSFNIPSNDKQMNKSKYPKYTNTNLATHTHSHKAKNTNDDDAAKPLSPVVVTLPESQKTIHQMNMHEKPIVVKLPPVIYHSNPQTYTQTTNTNNTQQPHNTHTEQQTQQQNTHNLPPHYTTTHYHQHKPHSNQYQQQPLSYSQNFYNPPPFQDSSSTFNAQAVYRSLDRTNESTDHAKQGGGLRYILRRPPNTHSSYGAPPPYSSSRVSRSSQDLFYRGL